MARGGATAGTASPRRSPGRAVHRGLPETLPGPGGASDGAAEGGRHGGGMAAGAAVRKAAPVLEAPPQHEQVPGAGRRPGDMGPQSRGLRGGWVAAWTGLRVPRPGAGWRGG